MMLAGAFLVATMPAVLAADGIAWEGHISINKNMSLAQGNMAKEKQVCHSATDYPHYQPPQIASYPVQQPADTKGKTKKKGKEKEKKSSCLHDRKVPFRMP